jgi:hypothetical protein
MTKVCAETICRSGGQPPHPRSIFEKSKQIMDLFAGMEAI